MARDYAAEYRRSVELAHERGFATPKEMRDAYNERNNIIAEAGDEPTGRNKHDLVSYFIDYEGMNEDEAVEAMREIFGRDTP